MSEINDQKILSLKVSNFKRIRVAHIKPDGKHVALVGENDQGKSSAMDSVMSVIDGAGSIPGKPLRDGASKGETEVELTDFIVRRTYNSKGGTSLTVKRKPDKSNVSRPQSTLDQLKTTLTFDPVAFSRMSSANQAETVKKLAGIDLTSINNELSLLEEKRLETGRQGRELGSELKVAKKYENVPDKEVSSADLMAELEAEEQKNRNRRQQFQRVETARQEIDKAKEAAQELSEKIAGLKQALKLAEEEAVHAAERVESSIAQFKKAQEELEGLPDGKVDEVKIRINNNDEINKQVRHNLSLAEKQTRYQELVNSYKDLDEQVKAKRNERTDILAQSQLPIDGLEFDEAGVTLNGIPFDQLGTATRMKVSTQIGIAMNPKLRVMFVRDASLMDDKTLAEVMKIADENGIQIWLEQVDENAPEGADVVVFEDGAVKFEGSEQAETVDPSPNAAPFDEAPTEEAPTTMKELQDTVQDMTKSEEANQAAAAEQVTSGEEVDPFFADDSTLPPHASDIDEDEDTEEF